MTSFHVICGLDLPQSKILGTPMNWRSPKKKFLRTFFFFFFWRALAPVSLVLGLEHSCPWPRECLSSERLSLALASDFFCVLGLGLEPCVLDSTSGVEYSTSEYEYRKKLRVRVLILKNVLEYEYRKKVRVRVLLQV